MTGARSSEEAGVRPFGVSRRLAVDAHRLGAGARPELPAPLRLEQGGDAGVRRRRTSSAATVASRIERRSSSTRTVRSAAHGATTRPRCRTSTSCFAPRRLCSARRRALPRGRRGRRRGRRVTARSVALPPGGAPAHGEASPGDHLQAALPLLARRPSARARPRALARPVHVPARGEAAAELRRLALRAPVLAARRGVRPRARAGTSCRSCFYVLAGRRRAPGCASSACPRGPRSSAGWRSRSRRTGSSRASATCSGRSRSCSRSSLWAFERARRGSRWWLVARRRARSRRSRFPGRCISRSGRSRSSSATRFCRTRDRAPAGSAPVRSESPRSAPVPGRPPDCDRAVDAVGRPLARRDLATTRRRVGRLRLAACRSLAQRAVRLPRLGDTARRDRRSRPPAPRAPILARRDSRARRARADRAGARNAHADLLRALARAAAVSLPARAGAPAADRVPRASRRCSPTRSRRATAHASSPCSPSLLLFVDLHAARLRQVRARRSGGSGAVGARTPARATRVRSRRPLRQRLPLVRHGGATPAARRLLDDRAEGREERSRTASQRLNCGDWSGEHVAGESERLGVGSIALHRGLFIRNPAVPSTGWFAARGPARTGLAGPAHGRPRLAVRARRRRHRAEPRPSPHTRGPSSARAGSPDTGSGRYMSETHAPFWIYGSGTLRARPSPRLRSRRVVTDRRTHRLSHARKRGWHLVAVDMSTSCARCRERRGRSD